MGRRRALDAARETDRAQAPLGARAPRDSGIRRPVSDRNKTGRVPVQRAVKVPWQHERNVRMVVGVVAFVLGLALGLIVIGFVALGSYERGRESARRERFNAELLTRRVVALSQRARPQGATEERATA